MHNFKKPELNEAIEDLAWRTLQGDFGSGELRKSLSGSKYNWG